MAVFDMATAKRYGALQLDQLNIEVVLLHPWSVIEVKM